MVPVIAAVAEGQEQYSNLQGKRKNKKEKRKRGENEKENCFYRVGCNACL